MEIIGISGYARAGKDEAAKALVEVHGFTRVAFADKLREMLYALNPLVAYKPYYNDGLLPPTGHSRVFLAEVIDVYGWGGYKETEFGDEIRRLLQRLGTEAGRETLWDNIWVDAALTGWPEDAKLVIPDVRFPNEADAIERAGGIVWRIERPGVGPANAHPSETALDDRDFDWTIYNQDSIEQLRTVVNLTYAMTQPLEV